MHVSSTIKRITLALLVIALVAALLVYGVGLDVIKARQVDLLYLGKQHLWLVGWSMLFALLVGIPSGFSQPPLRPPLGGIHYADL